MSSYCTVSVRTAEAFVILLVEPEPNQKTIGTLVIANLTFMTFIVCVIVSLMTQRFGFRS